MSRQHVRGRIKARGVMDELRAEIRHEWNKVLPDQRTESNVTLLIQRMHEKFGSGISGDSWQVISGMVSDARRGRL
jgi:hypothetical protein